jgi:exodeoxyribonuclease-1
MYCQGMKPVAVQYNDYINGDHKFMAIKPDFFNWYDTETTGLNAAHDQILQFAGIRTDANLNVVKNGEFSLLVKPRPDVVPGPKAFAVHGISIDELNAKGVSEFEAASHIRNWFQERKNSMMTGFNTLSFDDEIVRNTMYRTMQDPYRHEWEHKNSRSDMFRLVMMVYALRPHLINFNMDAEGAYRLTLGDMCKANGIVLDQAHDARFDVLATIDLARIIKQASPALWEYFLNLSDKNYVKPMIDKLEPLVLVDRYLSRDKGHVTMALPIIYDERTPNKMLCVDLRDDPRELLSLSAEELKRRVFTKSTDLPEGEAIKSIRDMTTNKQPLIATPNIFRGYDSVVDRARLDIDACMRNAEMIKKDEGFRERLREAHRANFPPISDVYEGIYSLGLISSDETNLRVATRKPVPVSAESSESLPALVGIDPVAFSKKLADPLRMNELTLRAKWANYGEEVLLRKEYSTSELGNWLAHLENVWHGPKEGKFQINLDGYRASLADVKASSVLDERQKQALVELEAHVNRMLELKAGLSDLYEARVIVEKETARVAAAAALAKAAEESTPVSDFEVEAEEEEDNVQFIADCPDEPVIMASSRHEESTPSL